jgi:hypothetical protein
MNEDLKKAYQEKMEAQLKEWGNKVEELKIKAEKLSADAKINAVKTIEAIKIKMAAGNENLKQLREAGEGSWEAVKTKLDAAGENIKKAIQDAISKLG